MSTTVDYFSLAMKFVFGVEGTPSDDPVNDPDGGLTRFGISQKQNPDVDVANITQAEAVVWYKNKFWLSNSCDKMPWPVSLALFDGDVNQGSGVGNRLLQESLKIEADGIIGSITLYVIQQSDPWDLTARFLAKRGVAYTLDKEWPNDGEGWLYRLASLALQAEKLLQSG